CSDSSYGDHRLRLSSPTRRSSDLVPLGERDHQAEVGLDHVLLGADAVGGDPFEVGAVLEAELVAEPFEALAGEQAGLDALGQVRSEEHTSELQSRENLVCRLLLEK